MAIAHISNGESGSSVRTKLNAAIDAVNAETTNPITYSGDPAFLRIDVTNQILLVDDIVVTGPVASITSGTVPGVTDLSFGAVQAIDVVPLDWEALETLDFGDAVLLSGSLAGALNALTSFTADNLEVVIGNWAWNMDSLTTMSLPAFRSGEMSFVVNALTSLSLPAYEDDGGNGIDITANSLTTMSLPAIVSNGFGITLTMASLQNFSFGSTLKSLAGNLTIAGAALTQASVNGILVSLAALDGTGGTTLFENLTVDLSGGTSATPSGAGLTAKTALEGRGCTITVN